MKANVQITASKKEFKNGQNGYEVLVDGMEGQLQCKMNFTSPLKAMRYMFLLSKRLELQIDNIQLAALSLAYQKVKEQAAQVVEDANAAAQEVADESEQEPAEAPAPQGKVEEQVAPSMAEQFNALKAKHPDAMLIFRCGDFYECYMEDAVSASDILGITLTKRQGSSVSMAGFPHHALDMYLPKLIRAGKRVAICDPIAQPAPKRKRRIKKEEAA